MKVYYAHCIALYDSKQEARDVKTLASIGFEVVNPNSQQCAEGYRAQGMDYFKRFADECDLIAFRALPDGSIPAGIATEIAMFVAKGKPVFELPSSISRRVLSIDSTREYLLEVGYR